MFTKLQTVAVLWTLSGPARIALNTKLQMVAVLWTLLGPARKMQNKYFFPLGPKPSTELLALAVLITCP